MSLIDLVFPKKCLGCGRYGSYICVDCRKKIRPGVSLGKSLSLFRYEGVIRKAIIALKYKLATDIAEEIVELAVKGMRKQKLPKKAVLVPIPMFWYKKNYRGFNQTEILGRKIAGEMGWDFEELLIKGEPTKPQAELSGGERRRNLGHAFRINPRCKIKETSYIVFDDVLTTGSTMNEAENTLKKAGIKKIFRLTIAQ